MNRSNWAGGTNEQTHQELSLSTDYSSPISKQHGSELSNPLIQHDLLHVCLSRPIFSFGNEKKLKRRDWSSSRATEKEMGYTKSRKKKKLYVIWNWTLLVQDKFFFFFWWAWYKTSWYIKRKLKCGQWIKTGSDSPLFLLNLLSNWSSLYSFEEAAVSSPFGS